MDSVQPLINVRVADRYWKREDVLTRGVSVRTLNRRSATMFPGAISDGPQMCSSSRTERKGQGLLRSSARANTAGKFSCHASMHAISPKIQALVEHIWLQRILLVAR
jgi:hypothetical protein